MASEQQPNLNGLIKVLDTILYRPTTIKAEVSSIIITNKDSSDIRLNLFMTIAQEKTFLVPEGQFILKAKHTFIWDTPLMIGQGNSIGANASVDSMLTYSLARTEFT